MREIEGIGPLVGAGVYTAVTGELVAALRDRRAVVCGSDLESAVRQLSVSCRCVTLAVEERSPMLRNVANVRVLPHTEVVCVDGIGRLESVVLRDRRTGRLSAIEADALFVLQRPRTSVGREQTGREIR